MAACPGFMTMFALGTYFQPGEKFGGVYQTSGACHPAIPVAMLIKQ
jgi:hypothetical protein